MAKTKLERQIHTAFNYAFVSPDNYGHELTNEDITLIHRFVKRKMKQAYKNGIQSEYSKIYFGNNYQDFETWFKQQYSGKNPRPKK